MSIPYERIVQWAAGPTAAIAGWLATQLINNVHIFGPLGISKSQVAQAIVDAITFGVTALVTYAAHNKWLTNLPQWWETSGVATASGVVPSDPTNPPPISTNGSSDDAAATEATLRDQLLAAGITPKA